MSIFSRLFGAKPGDGHAAPKTFKTVEHKGFRIDAQPYAADGQYQVAGLISKDVDGISREHRFVRADRFGGVSDAADIAILKAQQMIDQQGERLFGA